MGTSTPFKIRLLGELQLARGDGPALPLPASKKTRALLGYLIATAQPHRRERLCDFFWEGPDDPRAELRWSLSKIRPLFEGGIRLVADRQRAGIELDDVDVDLLSIRSLLGNELSAAPNQALKDAASLFRGEFLDGLDLPVCYRYQEWCIAEREAVSRLRLAVLRTLIQRLEEQPADALPYARALTAADPLSEAGHAAVIRLLSRLNRSKEAATHYERARRIFEVELGVSSLDELEEIREALDTVPDPRVSKDVLARAPAFAPQATPSAPQSGTAHPLVGRDAEYTVIADIAARTVKRQDVDVLLVTGEPGIGKSRLLACLAERVTSLGGNAWIARAFEPEAARPYGIWFDILRSVLSGRARNDLPDGLGVLLPEIGGGAEAGDRSRLFGAVLELLQQVASERGTAIMLDDIQWIDEASSSLLHYVARHLDDASGLLVVCAAREGEIDDNAAASSVLRSLTRERRLQTIELGPLDAEETAELVCSVDPRLDGRRIFAESDGNPLFTLELARAHRRGEAEVGPTIGTVIAGQFARLTEEAREVLLWAAAYGGAFAPEDLGRAAKVSSADLLMTLGELERRGLVRPVSNDAYDFTHDLVRQAAYRSVSQPRRKLLHRSIARVLHAASKSDTALSADVAYHAAFAGDHDLAARAYAAAGERALRLFANVEAGNFADRGLRHADQLGEGATKIGAQIVLLKIRILAAAGPGLRPLPPLIDRVTQAANTAEALGLQAAAATGHYLLSVLHQEAGDTRRAETSTLRAAAAGGSADGMTRANQLANTARCLLELETGVGRSRELIREAATIADPLGLELCELYWARGLLQRWDGDSAAAVDCIGRALAAARKNQDRWREYKCLTWLAMLEQELGRYSEMQVWCEELKAVAARLGEDETPFVSTLHGLALLAADEKSATDMFSNALERLRAVDDKSYLAYALNSAARLHLRAGRIDPARLCAAEALDAALAIGRSNEIALARAMLAGVGEINSAEDVEVAATLPADRDSVSARVRSTLLESAKAGARFQRAFPR